MTGLEHRLGIGCVTQQGRGTEVHMHPVKAAGSGNVGRSGAGLGSLGVLADVALGSAVLTATPRCTGCRTATLRLDLGDDFPPPPAADLIARAEVVARKGALVLAGADVRDTSGVLVARASGWFTTGDSSLAAPSTPRVADPTAVCDAASIATVTPGDLLGLVTTELRADSLDLVCWPHPGLANRNGVVHGGIQAFMMARALDEAAALSPVAGSKPLGLDLHLHRPVATTGVPVTLTARLVRAGRRVISTAATMRTAHGQLLASATGTATPFGLG